MRVMKEDVLRDLVAGDEQRVEETGEGEWQLPPPLVPRYPAPVEEGSQPMARGGGAPHLHLHQPRPGRRVRRRERTPQMGSPESSRRMPGGFR